MSVASRGIKIFPIISERLIITFTSNGNVNFYVTKVSVLKDKQIKEVVVNSLKRFRAFRIELKFGKVGFLREGKT